MLLGKFRNGVFLACIFGGQLLAAEIASDPRCETPYPPERILEMHEERGNLQLWPEYPFPGTFVFWKQLRDTLELSIFSQGYPKGCLVSVELVQSGPVRIRRYYPEDEHLPPEVGRAFQRAVRTCRRQYRRDPHAAAFAPGVIIDSERSGNVELPDLFSCEIYVKQRSIALAFSAEPQSSIYWFIVNRLIVVERPE